MASDGIRFTIPGVPVAKGRARVTFRDGVVRAYTPKKTVLWERDAKTFAQYAMKQRETWNRKPFAGCLGLFLRVGLPIPPSWPVWKREAALKDIVAPAGRPDLDNIVKAVKDSLNRIVWMDDSQVVYMAARKVYSDAPGIDVEVSFMTQMDVRTVKKADLKLSGA